jgi:hypothetical protein
LTVVGGSVSSLDEAVTTLSIGWEGTKVGVDSPLLLAVVAVTVGTKDREWFGVWPAFIVKRDVSSAAKSWTVSTLAGLREAPSLVGSAGGERERLLDLDPADAEPLPSLKVVFCTAEAFNGMPSEVGIISCTSTTGTGAPSSDLGGETIP